MILIVKNHINIELAVFDSAYRAVDFITSAWYRGDSRAAYLSIVDSEGTVLLRPDDLIGINVSEWREQEVV